MKPDWKNAPEWANWLAMDADGEWGWFAEEPNLGYEEWFYNLGTRYAAANIQGANWKNTKEQRCTD